MTEDDEAKQRAHDVAIHSSLSTGCILAPTSTTSTELADRKKNEKTKREEQTSESANETSDLSQIMDSRAMREKSFERESINNDVAGRDQQSAEQLPEDERARGQTRETPSSPNSIDKRACDKTMQKGDTRQDQDECQLDDKKQHSHNQIDKIQTGVSASAAPDQPHNRHHNKRQQHHQQQQNETNNNNNSSSSSSNNNNNNNHLPNIHRKPNHHHHQQQQQQQQYPSSAMSQDSTQSSGLQATPGSAACPIVSADYLAQLIKDKKQIAAFPSNVFLHVPRLVDEEIQRVRHQLFQLNDVVHLRQQPLELPEPEGEFISLQEKIYVPVDEHPEYNFVGRLLGPRGMTAKQLEQETGCKIMIRGKGSMRDKKKEEQNRGKANWEHLNDDLHVLITVEDTQTRAQLKLGRAIEEVRQLLVPVVDGEDELKKRQLMELAIINGTYRDCNYNEALGKMLNDAAYRQSQLVEHGASLTNEHHHHQHHHHHHQMMASASAAAALSNGSPPISGSSSGGGGGASGASQSTTVSSSKHFIPQVQHYPSSTTASSLINGSSGFLSAGSTPNPLQLGTHHQTGIAQHHKQHAQLHTLGSHNIPPPQLQSTHQHHLTSQPGQQHHHHPGGAHHLSHPTTVAVVAAAAAAAAAQQHHQTSGTQAGGVAPSSGPASHMHHSHAHSHQSSAAAAAAAAAALMSNPAAEANAILYAQQYHDFQHYAAMAAVAAASQQSVLQPPPEYGTHHPHSYSHHPHHLPPPLPPHHHHHHAAVAQAVAAATAANQQFQRQFAEQQQQQQQQNSDAIYHRNHQQQIDIRADSENLNGNNPIDFQSHQQISDASSVVTNEPLSEQQQIQQEATSVDSHAGNEQQY